MTIQELVALVEKSNRTMNVRHNGYVVMQRIVPINKNGGTMRLLQWTKEKPQSVIVKR